MLCDAVQAVGKIPVDAPALGVDYLVLGAHKFYGPLGAAALWVRKGAELSGYLVGGSQERRRRAGTENVPALVGLGAAAAAAREEMAEPRRPPRRPARPLRGGAAGARPGSDPPLPGLAAAAQHLARGVSRRRRRVAADPARPRRLRGLHRLRLLLGERRAEQDAARRSGSRAEEALSSLRVSFGIANTPEEVDAFLDALAREVAELRRAVA